ncbi:MAG: cobalt ECF transporter T component CbiQ [Candidatus Omnitrophota bacterium]|jgi:cobalt/nickel transport system permease protein
MNNINKNSFDIGYMDTLSTGDSFLHRLDPRAKVITTLLFIVTVVSFDKYALSALMPFFIYPVVLISIGRLPAGYLLKKILVVSPFALLVGIFNPFIDREILFQIGTRGISGGWVSYLSIVVRFLLTVAAALILIATTGFNAVCNSLIKFGVPKPFVVQLLFFYRYVFILTDEAERMVRARSLRTFHTRMMSFKVFVALVSNLLLRTLDRAERIYRAMCCRGFDGQIRIIRYMEIRRKEVEFIFAWAFLFVFFRYFNMPLTLGKLIAGVLK